MVLTFFTSTINALLQHTKIDDLPVYTTSLVWACPWKVQNFHVNVHFLSNPIINNHAHDHSQLYELLICMNHINNTCSSKSFLNSCRFSLSVSMAASIASISCQCTQLQLSHTVFLNTTRSTSQLSVSYLQFVLLIFLQRSNRALIHRNWGGQLVYICWADA